MRWRFAFAVLLLTGCPSISLLGHARTLDKGKTRFALGLSGVSDVVTRVTPNTQRGLIPVAPQPELALAHGVHDRVELGGRLWTSGLQFDSKFSVLRSAPDRGFDLAIAPSVGVVYVPMQGYVPSIPVQVAVLGGYHAQGTHLVVGPRLLDRIVFYQGAINTFWLGGSVGVSLAVTPFIRLMPELSVLAPVGSTASELLIQGGLGMLLGGE